MAPPKKTTEQKTPANNAAPGVIDTAEIRTFKSGGLPSIANVADDGPRIGHIADVAYFSGLFPGETPATLAIRILAGQSLGMDAAQALFDLETESPATIRYRPAGRTFEQTNDEIETSKAAAAAALDGMKREADRLTSETASATENANCGTCHNAREIVHKHPDGPDTVEPCPECRPAGSNVVKGPFSAENASESAGSLQENTNFANKRPLPIETADPPNQSDGTGNAQTSPVSVEQQGQSVDVNNDAPGSETTDSALSAAKAAEGVGHVDGKVVAAWRSSIANMCEDLGINPDEKTKTFDAKPIGEKKKYFDEVYRYYSGKIDEARKFVLARLREDGKTSIEAQKGFFMYAEVPFEPDAWTYAEAKKAEASIGEFLKSKGSNAATSVPDMVTAKQLGMIRAIAREAKVDADKECAILMNCSIDELSKRAASDLIERLQEMQRANG